MAGEFAFDDVRGTGVVVCESGGVTFAIENYSVGVPLNIAGDAEAGITRVKEEKTQQARNPNIKFWGEDNLMPNEQIEHIETNVLLSRAMEERASFHFGKGVYPFLEIVENGKRRVEPIFDAEISDFFELNRLNSLYFPESCADYEVFKIIPPELILSRDRKKINRLFHQKTMSMRWEQQNPSSMVTEHVYLSDYWDLNPGPLDYAKREALNPYYAADHLLQGKSFNYIFPCSLPSRRNRSYPVPSWYALVRSKWLQISNAVPEVKDAIFKNQMILKYHVRIPYSYWPMKYHDWTTKTQAQRTALISEEMDRMNTWLTDKKNSGKAFFSGYGFDPVTQKEYPGWVIEAIDDKLKDGAFIPDSKEASAHIVYGTGLHSALMGINMAAGQGSGSGSDIREAFLLHQAKMGIDRAITLSPIEFIADYNGWKKRLNKENARLKFGYLDLDVSETQDKNPTGTQNKVDGKDVDKNPTGTEKN